MYLPFGYLSGNGTRYVGLSEESDAEGPYAPISRRRREEAESDAALRRLFAGSDDTKEAPGAGYLACEQRQGEFLFRVRVILMGGFEDCSSSEVLDGVHGE